MDVECEECRSSAASSISCRTGDEYSERESLIVRSPNFGRSFQGSMIELQSVIRQCHPHIGSHKNSIRTPIDDRTTLSAKQTTDEFKKQKGQFFFLIEFLTILLSAILWPQKRTHPANCDAQFVIHMIISGSFSGRDLLSLDLLVC